MKKNVASQSIGSEMITAADGTDFTGSVTAYYTIDNGTQTIGSVGSGVCTHEGNGYHSYAPTQGETNGDHIAWTFIGSGAISSTIQVYTNFPQTGDGYAIVNHASYGNDQLVRATTPANTLDIEAGGTAGIDWGNMANKTTANDLSATDIQLCDTITTYTGNTPQTADHTAGIADIPTVAEFNARTLLAASYFDPAADTVANVTTVATTTTNTDMRGTDGANTTVPDAAGTAPTAIENRQEMDSNSTQFAAIVLDTGTTLPALIDDLAIKKNTAFSNFEFLMVLTSDHVTPATGLTVTGQRSIDGGAFAGVSGAIAEVSNGIYQFDALAADTNGDVITWRFSSGTADDTFMTFKTVA